MNKAKPRPRIPLIAIVLISIVLLALVFAWGFGSAYYKVFPYSLASWTYAQLPDSAQIQSPVNRRNSEAARIAEELRTAEQQRRDVLTNGAARLADTIYIQIANDPSAIREEIMQRTIVPNEVIAVTELERDDPINFPINFRKLHSIPMGSTVYKATYYGMNAYGVLRRTTHANHSQCLFVYIQGHKGNPFNRSDHNALNEAVLVNGCDVLSLSMTGIGLNFGAASYPIGGEPFIMDKQLAQGHDRYQWFHDPLHPTLEPMSLVLSGNYHLIKSISEEYTDITMAGISGGGWYTVMLAALLPEIYQSFSIAGTWPKRFHEIQGHGADWEEIGSTFWQDLDYWHFYFLSLLDANNTQSRHLTLIYHNLDECCYSDPSASILGAAVDKLSIEGLSVQVIVRRSHSLDVDFLLGSMFGGQ